MPTEIHECYIRLSSMHCYALLSENFQFFVISISLILHFELTTSAVALRYLGAKIAFHIQQQSFRWLTRNLIKDTFYKKWHHWINFHACSIKRRTLIFFYFIIIAINISQTLNSGIECNIRNIYCKKIHWYNLCAYISAGNAAIPFFYFF